jgi:hypothetical protein
MHAHFAFFCVEGTLSNQIKYNKTKINVSKREEEKERDRINKKAIRYEQPQRHIN